MTEDVLCAVHGPIGLITLNRPKALNALTLDMIRVIDPALRAWAGDPGIRAVVIRGAGDRAFCAGGDVRAVWDAGKARQAGQGDGRLTADFFREEYRLNRRIKTFPKPYIALLDGITMGGGVGLSVHGSHRVTTEKTLLAMPETGIGLFPDVGGTYFLPRLPGYCGTYLALTGARLQAADLHYLGIGTGHVPSAEIDALVQDFTRADWDAAPDPYKFADDITARYEVGAGEPVLPAWRETIDRCFAADSIEAILAALVREGSEWADQAAKTILSMSPTSLKVTLAQMRRGVELTFDDAMRLEFRMTQAVMAGHDFYEGIRAVLVDKDRSPRWNPAGLDAVDDGMIGRHFALPDEGDLTFGA
ncbi:enoyl-CoA hydratase/isomerase family protein [Oleisolibacter albus]|uniref:enoyl-CoA hydratase/isomerase family protein n=1 Tax=Oleisolibacter albus TaxID=2171757 RepID=UPI001EFD03F5|nr:enoyl-CoA hydratase/isomerase family protein [Oleisolibacter albus]